MRSVREQEMTKQILNLELLRKQQNSVTKKEMAKRLELEEKNYGNYENAKTKPTIEVLCKIADYYNVSLDYLCNHKTNNQLDCGNIDNAHLVAHNILQALPEQHFYEYLGRLKTTADMLGINYQGDRQ